ncbi:3-oxoacyl-[acyl-carrier protein] reductase [Conyzicola lurida]|uniref:3-oxoacyl-[acyl-carrier protein] reductase n=1 Tax=Conyzicola lurida TaxID=1172621 RepID=A0A841AIB5_9MICO|nr:3-oxoacyl-[acyl-carrier protein] reductase [Conyzicola lurida]
MTRHVVVITGGAGDIGRALAAEYLAAGSEVHLVDRNPDVMQIAADSGATGHVVDLTDADAVAVLGTIVRVDVLITAVGAWPLLAFDDLTPRVWASQIDINLNSTYYAVHTLRHGLRAAVGSVVAVSSAVALKGHPQMASYAAAKAGVIGMVKALALALGPDGVRVNAVAPGLVTTPAQQEMWGAERSAAFRATRALDRDIATADVVSSVMFLASAGASSITGQTLVVDGGTVLH